MLCDIVGQPAVRHLAAYVESVKRGQAASRCFALVGPAGVGKTASALSVAEELGCHDGFGGGLTVVDCSQFGVDDAEELFGRFCRLSVNTPYRWRTVILDEFEFVSKACQIKLKFWLDESRRPNRTVVIATSNDLDGISGPVQDRFKVMPYDNGTGLMAACQERLKRLWSMEVHGEGMPMGWTAWGRDLETREFSMRSALASLSEALAERELCAA